MTTLATFYTALTALAPTGVTVLSNPAREAGDLSSAKRPVMWVDSLGFDEAQLHAKSLGGDRTLRARLVVVTEAETQDRHANRWSDARAMADTLDTAIKTLGAAYRISRYSLDVEPNLLGVYFGVVAELEVEGFG